MAGTLNVRRWKAGRYEEKRYGWELSPAGTIAFAVLPAWTLEKPLLPVHLEEVDGMDHADEGSAEDRPFHWTRGYGTVYAPATARVIDLPLRSPIAALTREPTLVEITVGGRTREPARRRALHDCPPDSPVTRPPLSSIASA